ncbi:MAG: trigger factor, partial [Sphingomonadaceae bacterium]
MQTKETTNEGLKRGYELTLSAKEIDAKIDAEVTKIAPQVQMPGFRPGKVPANLVRKMHGEQLHAQVLNDTIRESVDKLMAEKKLRPAMQPAINLNDDYEKGKDAVVTVELEVLPEVEAPSVDGLKLERLTVPVSEEAVMETIERVAGNNKSYKDAAKTK